MKGFSKTRIPNLWRNEASGRFYAVARGPRKAYPVQVSLGTDKLAVARLRLDKALAKIRNDMGADTVARNNLTLGGCVVAYLAGKRAQGLVPSAQAYCERCVEQLRENLAGFDGRLVEEFTPQDAKLLMDRIRSKYSNRRFNGSLWALRGILGVAVKAKVLAENVALEIEPETIGKTELVLPAEEKIELLMDRLRRGPQRFEAFLFCLLMLESGARPGAIRLLRANHVNLATSSVKWQPFKHSKQVDELPMTRRMKAVFRLLLGRHRREKRKPDAPLIQIVSPRKALIGACKEVGIKPALTPHKFRHICSTRMAEQGVPYALAAKYRRDTDGGRTFMKVYVHPRPESLRQVVRMLDARNREEDGGEMMEDGRTSAAKMGTVAGSAK